MRPDDRKHEVVVRQHPYGYWRAQCLTCGMIQDWRSEIDAEWWAGMHEQANDADR